MEVSVTLEGCHVFSYKEDGKPQYHFVVVKEITDGYFLLQAVSPLTSEPNIGIIRSVEWLCDKIIVPSTKSNEEYEYYLDVVCSGASEIRKA